MEDGTRNQLVSEILAEIEKLGHVAPVALDLLEKAYNAGRDAGNNIGYRAGYNVGYQAGYNVGYQAGYNVGYNACFNIGYNAWCGVTVVTCRVALYGASDDPDLMAGGFELSNRRTPAC